MEIKYIKLGMMLYIVLMSVVGTTKAIDFYIFKQKTTLEIMAKNTIYEAEKERMDLQLKIEKEKKKKCLNYIK